MKKNKMSPLTAFLLFTLSMYAVGFFLSKNTYIASKIVITSMMISILILLVLVLRKCNIATNHNLIFGTIGMNNAILCAVLNSIEIGRNLTQQVFVLSVHLVIFFVIIVILEICFRKKKFIQKFRPNTKVSSSLITLVIGLGLFLSRFLLQYGIDIRVVSGLSCGFLANTMFYIFLIYERLSRKDKP